MIWLLAVAALVVVIAGGYVARIRRLGPAAPPLVLPEAPSPLQVRLLELDAAIADLRTAWPELSPEVLRRCAARARGGISADVDRFPRSDEGDSIATHGRGPGTMLFERLIAAVSAIDEEDRRTLEDAGIDPRRILEALNAALPPQRWATQLEQTLDYVRAGLRKLPERRYG
jgi:hypothetical protein